MITEAVGFLSVLSIGYGFYSIYQPLGFISAGGILLTVCILSIRNSKPKETKKELKPAAEKKGQGN